MESQNSNDAVSYGDMDTLKLSGARNELYLIPAMEHDSGKPHVFVWSDLGGCPERAYNGRWHGLGSVDAHVDPEDLERALRTCEAHVLAINAMYEGTRWNGNNTVGVWAGDPDEHVYAITAALFDVDTIEDEDE